MFYEQLVFARSSAHKPTESECLTLSQGFVGIEPSQERYADRDHGKRRRWKDQGRWKVKAGVMEICLLGRGDRRRTHRVEPEK